ncbi:unnamed protein product [Calypogeia fissa]
MMSGGADLLIQKLQRDLNCLSDPDRSTRRRALERLPKRLLSGDPGESAAPSPDLLQAAWDGYILRLVGRSLSDPVEKCRELAVQLISSVAKKIPRVEQTVLHIVPVIAERMGQKPVLEESEEIRFQLVNLIAKDFLPGCPASVCFDTRDHLFQVVMSAIADQFHEIKKAACQIIVQIRESAPQVLEDKTELLLKALLPNLNHSHFRVRMGVLQAVDALVLSGLPPGVVSEQLAPGVKALAFDRSTGLRALFFTCVARWLGWEEKDAKGNYKSVLQDRDPRVHIPHLLPLLLLGVTDESTEVSANSLSLVERVGFVYERYMHILQPSVDKTMVDAVEDMTLGVSKSNQDDIMKNSIEDKDVNGDGGDLYAEFNLPAPFKGRPSIGCRKMVQAFLSKLLKPTMKDLLGWTIVVRLGAARLAHTLLILAEEQAVDYLDILIPAVICAVGDDEVAVAQQIMLAVHVLGFHTKAEYWLPLALNIVTTHGTADAQRANGLVVMAGLLYGTPKRRIHANLVLQLNDGLAEEIVRCSDHPAVRRQLLLVMSNLLGVAEELCDSSSLQMFLILIQLQSADGDPELQEGASQVADALAKVLGLTSENNLYERHIDALIPLVTAGHEDWSGSSPVKALFHTFTKNSGSVVGPYLGMVVNMFGDCLHEGRDPALRIGLFQLLDDLLENEQLAHWWSPLAEQVILEILIPCSVWRIGKVGAAIRHRSMVALGTFLRRDLCSQGQLLEFLKSEKGMLGVIISCLDEDYYVDTRRVTCHVMQHLIRIAGLALEDAHRSAVSTELQKRMEDSSDAVRIGILPAIATFFETMPTSYSDEAVKGFLNNLIVHMDDTSPQIQDAVCMAMESCIGQRPKLVIEVATIFRSRHRSTSRCDHLIALATTADSS